jgi:hypothetical protein
MYVKHLGWGATEGMSLRGRAIGAVRLGIDFRWHVQFQQAVYAVDRGLIFVGSRRGEVPVYIECDHRLTT